MNANYEPQRRKQDIEEAAELKLMRHEINALLSRFEREDKEDDKRLEALELAVGEFRRRLAYGKGILFGITFMLGALGFVFIEWIKEMYEHLQIVR